MTPERQGRDGASPVRGELAHARALAAFVAGRRHAGLIFDYNHTPPQDGERLRALLTATLGSVGRRPVLLPPFQAADGGNVHIGDDFYGNVNLTLIDDAEIRIGDDVIIAADVTLTTTAHPVHPAERVDFARSCEPIVIEDRVWIGSNVVVLPGVRIGYGSVIGAGSVVDRSVPPMVVAAGAPCRVLREITDDDLAAPGAPGPSPC